MDKSYKHYILGFIVLCIAYFSFFSPFNDIFKQRISKPIIGSMLENKAWDKLLEPDSFHLILCGTRSPLSIYKVSPCNALFINGKFFLVDTGYNSQHIIQQFKLPGVNLTAVFLTHFHSVHIDGLPTIADNSWIMGRKGELPIYGIDGIYNIIDGFNMAFQYNSYYMSTQYKNIDIINNRMEPIKVLRKDEASVCYNESGIIVTAFKINNYPVPSTGYKFEYNGKSVVISDNTINTDNIEYYSKTTDILVHDIIDYKTIPKTMNNIFYHASAKKALNITKNANVKTLILTQTDSHLSDWYIEQLILDGLNNDINVVIGKHGMYIKLL